MERDVCAESYEQSVSEVFGWDVYRSCVGFCGLYAADPAEMSAVVATVATHRGCGWFVVSVRPKAGPMVVTGKGGEPWYDSCSGVQSWSWGFSGRLCRDGGCQAG